MKEIQCIVSQPAKAFSKSAKFQRYFSDFEQIFADWEKLSNLQV